TEDDRVTVGRGACDFARSHRAAAAGIAIFDDDPLPERVAHLVRDSAGHNIVGAAGRQRDDENNGATRIVVGRLAYRDGEENRRRQNPSERYQPSHALLHFFLAQPAYQHPDTQAYQHRFFHGEWVFLSAWEDCTAWAWVAIAPGAWAWQ